MRQVKSKKADLALYATDDADGFTKISLSMPRRMQQRYEHLLRPLSPTRHVVLHNRDAACEAVLVPKPLEDSLRRMPLLLRSRLVVPKNAVDQCNKWIKLRLRRRLLAHITPAAPRTLPFWKPFEDQAQTVGPPPARSSPRSEPHSEPVHIIPRPSSPALCQSMQRAICCRIITPAQPAYPAASVRDYSSGALIVDLNQCDLVSVTSISNVSRGFRQRRPDSAEKPAEMAISAIKNASPSKF